MSFIFKLISLLFNRLSSTAASNNDAELLLKAHNQIRQNKNISALVLDPRLTAAATKHAQWMHKTNTMDHRGEHGSNHGTRILNEGYKPSCSGENIAYGYTKVETVMSGWMKSFMHRTNIMSIRYMHVGFGRSGNYWCTVFATPGYATMGDSYPYDITYESGPLTSDAHRSTSEVSPTVFPD